MSSAEKDVKMPGLNQTLALALHGVFSLMGLVGNTFTLSVNVMAWRQGQGLTTSNLIVSSIAASNLCLAGSLAVNELCFFLWKDFYFMDRVMKPFAAVLISLFFSSLWCSTWLCIYYCVKIVNHKTPSCIRLKEWFPKAVPCLLLGTVLGSTAIGIPSAWDLQRNSTLSATAHAPSNNATKTYPVVSRCDCLYHIYIAVALLAFTLFAYAAASILLSLCSHMRRMTQNADSFRSPRLDAHWGAAKTVTSLLVLYTSFYLSLSIIFSEVFSPGTWQYSVCVLIVACSPALTSLILILGNPRLKKTLVKVLFLRKSSKMQIWTWESHQEH